MVVQIRIQLAEPLHPGSGELHPEILAKEVRQKLHRFCRTLIGQITAGLDISEDIVEDLIQSGRPVFLLQLFFLCFALSILISLTSMLIPSDYSTN